MKLNRAVLNLLCWVFGCALGIATGAGIHTLWDRWEARQNEAWLDQDNHWVEQVPDIAGGMHTTQPDRPKAKVTERARRRYRDTDTHTSQLQVAAPWDLQVAVLTSIPTRWREEAHRISWVDAQTLRLHLGHLGGPHTALDVEFTNHALD